MTGETPFVAALFREGEAQPYAHENMKTSDQAEAERLAQEWAMAELSQGVFVTTRLFLIHNSQGKCLRTWESY